MSKNMIISRKKDNCFKSIFTLIKENVIKLLKNVKIASK